MRRVAGIWIFLVVIICYHCYGNSILLRKGVRPSGVIHERSWCGAELKRKKHFFRIDLGSLRTITGIATRKDDTAVEFRLSYKKDKDRYWHLYKEGGLVKIFEVNEKSQGLYSRQWFRKKISARYLHFRVTGWKKWPACLHLEVYGLLDNFEISVKNLKKDGLKALSREDEDESNDLEGDFEDDQKVERDKSAMGHIGKPTISLTQKKDADKRILTIGLCFLATGIIALLAMIIVCKWERNERKISPDVMRAELRQKARSNLRK